MSAIHQSHPSSLLFSKTPYSRIVVSACMFFLPFLMMQTAIGCHREEPATAIVTVDKVKQLMPEPSFMPAAAYDRVSDRIIAFGGRHPNKEDTSGQLLALDLATDQWSTIKTTGTPPSGTTGPAMAYVEQEDAIYVFGGWPHDQKAPVATLSRLLLKANETPEWKTISEKGDWPRARNGCCMVLDSKRNRLILHGGDGGPHPTFGFIPLDDLWEFDLK